MKKNQWMKKCCAFVGVMVSMFAVCGCGNKADKLKPYEWLMDDKVVSFYDSKAELEEVGCPWFEDYFEAVRSDNEDFGVSRDGETLCYMEIADASIVTYKDICVGDEITKVEDTFSYELPLRESYSVCFDGATEVEIDDEEDWKDNYLVLYYYVEDGIIERIVVTDGLFMRTMR